MKKFASYFLTIFLLSNVNAFSAQGDRSLLEKLFNKDLPGGSAYKNEKRKNAPLSKVGNKALAKCKDIDDKSLLEKIIRRDLPGRSAKKSKCIKLARYEESKKSRPANLHDPINDLSLYTGTFDVLDKEGDDQTALIGIEHKNPDLFKNTFLGKFSPITGGFVTGKSSAYLYTGIEGQYKIGALKILPSFAPGYYESGNGKDLGSVLEFKSELKVAYDIFENSKLGYSYSHISNNDWGEKNPGTDNQQLTFSKNF